MCGFGAAKFNMPVAISVGEFNFGSSANLEYPKYPLLASNR